MSFELRSLLPPGTTATPSGAATARAAAAHARRATATHALRGSAILLVITACAGERPQSAREPDAPTGTQQFWSLQRKGANAQQRSVEPAYWTAVRAAGITFVRLVPDGWAANGRDFLIGDASAFTTIDTLDLAVLRRVLDDAHDAGVRIVLTMFSLPGARWRQLNQNVDDGRLWTELRYHAQAAAFWRELADALRGHPAIVAYNPLNEPHPARADGIVGRAGFMEWYAHNEGTAADLNGFNRRIVATIREVDATTPILLDGWFHASAEGLTMLEPVDDAATLYAFHVYEPWEYTTYRVNAGRFSYPAAMPRGWSADTRAAAFRSVAAWAAQHSIPARRIVVSEFGVDRRVRGAQAWLEDIVAQINANGWHWAFYAYRSDDAWGGMDYELGTAPAGEAYWTAVERGADPESLKRRAPNPLWAVLAREFEPAGH